MFSTHLRNRHLTKRLIVSLLCAASFFAGASNIFGQAGTGNISGSVSDQNGARVPNATVLLTQTEISLERTATTGESGEFSFTVLPVGVYSITVEATNYKRKVTSGIELRVDQTPNIEIALETGNITETVQVTSETPLLDTEKSSVGQVIENETIVNLPLNGRNPFALGQLSGNAVVVTGLGNLGQSGSPPPFIAGGARYTANDFLLDGVDNNTFQKNIAYIPSVDAIQEFKVQTNSFSAEFGRASGVVVNATIKSGTNDFNGSLFEFIRNEKFDANNFFTNATPLTAAQRAEGLTRQPRAPFRQNQFGGAIGGPLFFPAFGEGGPYFYNGRNKTFFFFDYQGTRQRTSASSAVIDVPTAAARAGNFSAQVGALLFLNAQGQPTTTPTTTPLLNSDGTQARQGQIYDPATRRLGADGRVIADPFPGNIVPLNRINQSVAQIVSLIPNPNSGASGVVGRFLALPRRGFDNDQFDARIDQTLRGSDRLTGRYSYFKGSSFTPGNFAGAVDSGSTAKNKIQNAVISYTGIFGANLVNETRFGWTRINSDTIGNGSGQAAPGFATFPFPVQGFPQINFNFSGQRSGPQQFASLGGSPFNATDENRYQISDNVTITSGNHSIKTGVDFRHYQYDSNNSNNGGFGAFYFGSTFTGIALNPSSGAPFADFLLGLPSFLEGTQQLDLTRLRQNLFGVFVQDDYKVSRRLTLNLGVRYDIFKQPLDARDTGGFFDVATGRIARPGQDGYSRAILADDYNNIAPRVGLAYQLTSKIVLRAAYGIFYTDQERNPQSNVLAANAPNIPLFSVPAVTQSGTVTPPLSIGTPIVARPFDVNFSSFSPAAPFSATLFAPDFENFDSPRVQQYNASVQYEPFRDYVIEVSYLGSRGSQLGNRVNLNQVPLEIANSTTNTAQLNRRFAFVNGLVAFDSSTGRSNYNAGNLRVERRFVNNFSILANYTYSKSIEFGVPGFVGTFNQNGGTSIPLDSYNLSREKAVSPLDITHRAVISSVFELPFGRGQRFLSEGILANIFGGFQINGIYTAQSGYPSDVRFGTPPARTFATQNVPDLVPGQPVYNPDWRSDPLLRYLNPAAFTAPPSNRFGNLGKRFVRGPSFTNLDLSVLRNIRFNENFTLQLRAEAFNVTNTPQFSLASANTSTLTIGNPNFGRIVTSGDVGRQLQFGIKLLF